MTVASLAKRPWWHWLPKSWIAMQGEREGGLDETGSFQRRRWEDMSPPPAPRVSLPVGVIVTVAIYLIGQLGGSIWWGATMQADLRHEIADRAREERKLWDEINTLKAYSQSLREKLAESGWHPNIKRSSNRQSSDDED